MQSAKAQTRPYVTMCCSSLIFVKCGMKWLLDAACQNVWLLNTGCAPLAPDLPAVHEPDIISAALVL